MVHRGGEIPQKVGLQLDLKKGFSCFGEKELQELVFVHLGEKVPQEVVLLSISLNIPLEVGSICIGERARELKYSFVRKCL